MLKSGTIFAERYGIQEKIGSGGMADVYKAIDTRLNREVAIKVLKSNLAQDPEILHRFRVEGRAAAGLDNENTARNKTCDSGFGIFRHKIVFHTSAPPGDIVLVARYQHFIGSQMTAGDGVCRMSYWG